MAQSQFVDEVQLNAKGGDGGAGCVSFRREAHVPKGGPDGGDGGQGGDVLLRADRNTASLLAFRDHPHRKGESGAHGSSNKKHGHQGKDLIVSVPEGTTVHGPDGEIIADLVRHGATYLAAAGGRGGRGNTRFLTNARRAPSFAEQGEYGEEKWLRLELRLMADAALVGFPNAGKSTLISAVSAARPKIADYPFTTLEPNLGVVRFQEHEFVLADIPGLIEGAAVGKGLGHRFLRHVERARVLVILLDLDPVDGRSPEQQERILLAELGSYQPDLLERPRLRVGSKADAAPEAAAAFEGLTISAITRQGLDRFLGALGNLVHDAREVVPEPDAYVIHRPATEGFTVVHDDDGKWRVTGRSAERVVAMADLTNVEAMEYVQDRLRKLGVERALTRAGVRDGDIVRIGPVEMQFMEGLGVIGVVKIGTSSLTTPTGAFNEAAIRKLGVDVVKARAEGHEIVLVVSGAIAAGMPALGLETRPTDVGTLQALAAVGQPRLMSRVATELAEHGAVAGQVLLTAHDFGQRSQYLHARETLRKLLALGVIPVVNENDTVADDEIRYGDNDRLAALVAHLVGARALVLLTDTPGLFTADPRLDTDASLIEQIEAVDAALEAVAGGAGTERGSGGMASKLAAAKIAAWSGVRAVIAAATAPDVVCGALAGEPVGTAIVPRPDRLSSRKLWIAFAMGSVGRIVVDDGARRALTSRGRSLLPAGVRSVEGAFEPDAAVEVAGEDGAVFAKGIARQSAATLRAVAGMHTGDLPEGVAHEVIHRDDLVVLP